MIIRLDRLLPILRCPVSGSTLSLEQDMLISTTGARYPIIDGIPVLLPDIPKLRQLPQSYKKRESSALRKKLRRLLLVSANQESRQAITSAIRSVLDNKGNKILVVGAGTLPTGPGTIYDSPDTEIVSLDIYGTPTVNVIGDGHCLPLVSDYFDCVVIQSVLEHVFSPQKVVSEIHRVLTPGGIVVADTPFMYPVHGGAYDFTRFSQTGYRWLFRHFDEITCGPSLGVGAAFTLSAKYFFSALTRSKKAGTVLALPFALARMADRFIPRPYHFDAAGGYYFIGTKAISEVPQSEVIRSYQGAQRAGSVP
jgi:SAM-dependent methyltransferase